MSALVKNKRGETSLPIQEIRKLMDKVVKRVYFVGGPASRYDSVMEEHAEWEFWREVDLTAACVADLCKGARAAANIVWDGC